MEGDWKEACEILERCIIRLQEVFSAGHVAVSVPLEQLVAAANAFALVYLERGRHATALTLLKKAEHLTSSSDYTFATKTQVRCCCLQRERKGGLFVTS